MESISRLSSMLEQARDLTLDAARDAGANRKPPRPLPAAQIKRMLDSRIEREVIDGLRKVIEMQYTSPLSVTLPFFPAVLKTLSNPTSLTRSLVYAYLTRHAEADADTALLSINTIQKSFSDSNPRVRALALRTMSGLRVPVISQIVSLAIKKAATDASPVVRKTAAFACVKCAKLDPRTLSQVTGYLDQLLGDQQYYVVGAAMAVFAEVCPDRTDLLHRHYHAIVQKLVDMDEWGQLATLRMLTRYARQCFPYRTKRVKKSEPEAITTTVKKKPLLSTDDFYADDDEPPNNSAEPADEVSANEQYEDKQILDSDLEVLLNTAEPLLQSRNSAVTIAVTKAYLYLSPDIYLSRAVPALIALIRRPQDIRQTSLSNIVQVCGAYPSLFVPYFRHFLSFTTDGIHISLLKLELLSMIFPHCKADVQGLILAELDHCARAAAKSNDEAMVREAVRAIGRCAQSSSTDSVLAQCTRVLLDHLYATAPDESSGSLLVEEALEVVRHLIQRDPVTHQKTVVRLAKNLDTLTAPTARASVIWLVGEFAASSAPEQGIAPDVLRILVRGYVNETDLVREQIILLAAKTYLHWLNFEKSKPDSSADETPRDGPHPIELLWQHTLLLVRYTPSYDLRDRARLFRALLEDPTNTDLASLLLLAPKPVPSAPSPSESRRKIFDLGTSSLIVGPSESGALGLKDYENLPDWVSDGHEPDPALRDVVKNTGNTSVTAEGSYVSAHESAGRRLDDAAALAARTAGASTAMGGKVKTLDKWLDESDGEGSSADDETESGEAETESEDGSSEESTDDSDDDGDEGEGQDEDSGDGSENSSGDESSSSEEAGSDTGMVKKATTD